MLDQHEFKIRARMRERGHLHEMVVFDGMELANISHLQNLAEKLSVALNGMQFETNMHRLRLSDIISMLKSVHNELQDKNVFLCLEKEVEKRLKCGLHRIEFLVNEIKASDPQGTHPKSHQIFFFCFRLERARSTRTIDVDEI